MNADEPDDFDDDDEDEDEDDDDSADKGEGGEHDDDDENGWEDDEDGDEPETWQVVDFPAAYCLDWPDFPAQPGRTSSSRPRVATAVLPRWRP